MIAMLTMAIMMVRTIVLIMEMRTDVMREK